MTTAKCIVFLALLLLASCAWGQQVHRWVDEDGNVHFSQTPPPDQSQQESEIVSYGRQVGKGVDASCCHEARSFAIEVADYLRNGGSLTAVYEVFPVSTYPQIVEIVNFFGGRTTNTINSLEVANRVHGACMNRAPQAVELLQYC